MKDDKFFIQSVLKKLFLEIKKEEKWEIKN